MPDAVFFDILPRFDWAASEAGQKRLIGQFDSAAKQISRTFGVEAGNAATAAVDKISADMRGMQNAVATATTAATNDYRKMILAQGDLEASTLRVVEAVEKSSAESSQYAAALARQEAAIVKATAATDAYVASTARETEATRLASAAAAQHAAAIETAGSKAAVAGAAFNTAGKVGLAVFAGAVYETGKAAGDFQQSQMRLVSSAGETQQGMQVVSDGILKLAGTVGYSAEQLSKGMYTVESAGYRGADGIKVMTAAAQGAKAENADLSKVTDGLTTSMTDFGFAPDKAALVMSKLVTAVGESKANFEEFTGSLHSVEPAAASAGISLDDVYGSLARITQSGTSADQATQNMADAIRHLQTATGPMRDEFAALGLDVNDVQDHLGERGLAGTMQLISNAILNKMGPDGKVLIDTLNTSKVAADDANRMFAALPPQLQNIAKAAQTTGDFAGFRKQLGGMNLEARNLGVQWLAAMNRADGFSTALKSGAPAAQAYTTALQKATGDVAGMNVALQLTGAHATEANEGIKKVADTTTDADGKVKGFGETQETLNAKFADAKAAFGAAAIQLGNDFIPELTATAQALSSLAGFLADHKAILDALVITVGGLGAAWVAAKAAMAIGSLISTLGTGMATIGGFVTGLAGRYDALAVSAEAAANAERDAASAGEGGAFSKGGAAGTAARGAIGTASAALPFAAVAGGFALWGNDFYTANDDGKSNTDAIGRARGGGRTALGQPAPGTGVLPNMPATQGPGAQAARRGVDTSTPPPGPTGVDAAADAAQQSNYAADGGSDYLGGGGGGGGKGKGNSGTDAATAANIDANLPFHPIDLNPANKPANETFDEWISSQKAVTAAMTDVDKSALEMSKAQAAHAALVKKGTATQEEWNRDAAAMAKAQLDNSTATQNLTIARMKADEDANKPAKGAGGSRAGGGVTGTSTLTGDFDFSPKGIATYFTTMLADLALGNPIGKQLAADRGSASNPLYVTMAGNRGGLSSLLYGSAGGGAGGINSDAALLANVPAGRYANSNTDLVKGLADCSSSVGDLVNIMDGRGSGPGAGQRLTTGNAAEWLPAHGFMPGSMPGAFNVGYNDHHMQATLPGGTPWNWGSDAAAARGGVGGTGAFDSAFTQHYYRPVGGDGASLYSPANTNPALSDPTDLSDINFGGGGSFGLGGMPGSPAFKRSGGNDFGGIGTPGQPGTAPGQIGPFAAPSVVAAKSSGLAGGEAGRGLQGADLSGVHWGTKAAAAARPASQVANKQFGAGQAAGGGFSSSIGSTAASIAGPALDALAPGASIAAQKGGQLLDRTIGYIGQLGGIAASGAIESLLPGGAGDALANPSKSWLGKVAIGVAGGHSGAGGGQNMAGLAGPPTDPNANPDDSAKSAATNAAPATPKPDQAHQGSGAAPGPGNDGGPLVGQMNITTTQGVDGGAVARDMNRYAGAKRG